MIKSLRPTQNGRHFADDTFKWFFLNEKVWISIESSLKFVPKAPINSIPALVQIMAWRRPGDKPLTDPMMVRLPTHICVTRPQWVNTLGYSYVFFQNSDMFAGLIDFLWRSYNKDRKTLGSMLLVALNEICVTLDPIFAKAIHTERKWSQFC